MTGDAGNPGAVDAGRFARNWAFLRRRLARAWHGGALGGAWQPWKAIAVGTGVVLVLALALAIGFDGAAAAWAAGLDGPFRRFFRGLTHYGRSGWLLVLSGLVCIVLFAGDWKRTTRPVAAAWSEVAFLAGFFFFACAASGILLNIVKQFVGRTRPVLLPEQGPFSFDPFMFDYAYQSFPSGHAQVMGVVAMTAVLAAPRYAVIVVVPALLIAASRVVVGAHYPSDVLAGFAFGAGFTWLYAVALAAVGIGFDRRDNGLVSARTIAIRETGLGRMTAGLLSALRP